MNSAPTAWLVAFSRNRHLLGLTIALVLVAGISAFFTLPRIEDPRITTRNAIVMTPFPGASAARVEAQVTREIEERLREIPEVKKIESTSRSGISIVVFELQDDVDSGENERVFSRVRDRIDQAADTLPAGAGRPEFDDMRGAVACSLIIAMSSDASPGLLTREAERLAERLRNVAGTEQVVLFGAVDEEVLVEVDAARLAALGLPPGLVAGRIAEADGRRSAGTLRQSGHNLPLELTGAIDSTARVAAVPLAVDARGGMVSVGDVATVTRHWAEPAAQIALHDGRRSILVAVRTEADIRVDHWGAVAREALAGFRSGLDPAIRLETVFDQSHYTAERLGALGGNLVAGAAVVILVVLVMMGWRAALIVGSALPLSAGATLFGLSLFGEPIHQMTIFGLIVAIGLLIDNAIIMTDQVIARRREGATAEEAVASATSHLFSPLLASTLTTIIGFMPILLLKGNVGDFVGPIAVAVVLALAASFLLSMTVIPALAGLLGMAGQEARHGWWCEGVGSARLGGLYRSMLLGALHRPWTTVLLTALLPLGGFALFADLDMAFFPPADRDQIEVKVWMPSATSIEQTVERLTAIEAHIHDYPGVEALTWVAGGDSPPVYYNQLRLEEHRPEYARGVVQMSDSASAEALVGPLQQALAERFPDAQVVVAPFGQGPPVAAPVGFRIIGTSPATLRELGEGLRALLHDYPEVTTTRASILGGEPKLWLAVDEQQAQLAGFTIGGIAAQFQAALDGRIGGELLEDTEAMPVRVRYRREQRDSLEQVGALRLNAPGRDTWLPASALGELGLRPELAGITRYNGERVNVINAFLRPGAMPIEVTRAVQARLAAGALKLPPGYRIETAGDSEEQQLAVGQMVALAPVLALLMLSALVLTFDSFALASLVGVVALFAVGLGVLSLWLGGYPLGFNPIIGSAGLIGVAINASIVVLAAIRANGAARGGDAAAIVEETIDATRHIVSTTLTTVAGFIPLLLFTGGSFWPPLAVVIAGGVGLSAVLSLLFTPAAYYLMSARQHSSSPAA